MGTGQCRRSAANDRNLFTAIRGAVEQLATRVEHRIRCVALQEADAHRLIFVRVAHARFLAEYLGWAHACAHAAHDVLTQNRACRAANIVATYLLNEAGNVDVGGAGGRARGVEAKVAAIGLDQRFGTL